MPKHKGADYLAMAAQCAGDQNKFWEFQDILFDYKKTNISRVDLMNDAVFLELDIDRFALCLDNRKYFSAVQKDMEEVDSVGVNATPIFIINGKLHPGAPDEQTFSVKIKKDLNRYYGQLITCIYSVFMHQLYAFWNICSQGEVVSSTFISSGSQ